MAGDTPAGVLPYLAPRFLGKEFDGIRDDFKRLNPYDPKYVPESILEVEDENFTGRDRTRRRQLYCYAISAKRYALFARDDDGNVSLRASTKRRQGEKWSEHGLGHLLNSIDPDGEDRDWIRELWRFELERALGGSPSPPHWLDRPAVGRITISKPNAREPSQELNAGKLFAEQIKPFNFLLTCQVASFGHPVGVDPERFQLIAPWEPDSRRWVKLEWFNKYSNERESYGIDSGASFSTAGVAKVNSYSDVLSEYRVHPEPKSLSPDRKPAGWHADGLLARRPVTASRIIHIGKESNELDDIQAGTVHDPEEVLNEYVREDLWRALVLPVLQAMTRSQLRDAGLSGSSISRTRTGVFRGTGRTRHRLTKVAGDFARAQLRDAGVVGPSDPIDCCASLLQLQRDQGPSRKLT